MRQRCRAGAGRTGYKKARMPDDIVLYSASVAARRGLDSFISVDTRTKDKDQVHGRLSKLREKVGALIRPADYATHRRYHSKI